VVRNEFESGENSPANVLAQRVLGAAYTAHNYGKPTIGNRSDIENVPIERLAAFYSQVLSARRRHSHYRREVRRTETLAWVAESFAAVPRPLSARSIKPTRWSRSRMASAS